jgi:hypothetical protein
MIDLRMVADQHGYTQLQSRSFCIQRGWTEWKSVPIVHDPSQFVAGVEVFASKTSGAKPDGGLTASQVAKILKKLEDKRDECDKAAIASNNERFRDSQNGWSDGMSNCLLFIRSELNPQPDGPSVDEDQADHPF